MKKQEFIERVKDIKNNIEIVPEPLRAEELKQRGCTNPLIYGAWCEHNMELNLREDTKRKYTFTSDLSIAEWFLPKEGIAAAYDTIEKELIDWCYDDYKAFAELIISVNLKAWEHAARHNETWAMWYSEMYYRIKDLYFDNFADNDDAINYYFDYVD